MTVILQHYSAKKTIELAGFDTVAMLDYLQRSGVFVPRQRKSLGRGKGRQYSFRDIIVLKAIRKLLDSGASVANLKNALVELQERDWIADPAALEDRSGAIRLLIASRAGVYLAKDAQTLIDLSRQGQLAFSFVIDLEKLHDELRTDLGLPVSQQELSLSAG